ncbi:cytochrome P450 76C1-like protein [Tanacetum coccineum]
MSSDLPDWDLCEFDDEERAWFNALELDVSLMGQQQQTLPMSFAASFLQEVSGNPTINSFGDQRPTPANPNAKQYGPTTHINLRIPPRPPGYAFVRLYVVAECRKCGSKDFLQMLLDPQGQKDGPRSLNKYQIKALLMDIMAAATNATLTMVEWVMAEILNNPSVKREVQDEPGEVIDVHMVKETHLPKLT